MFSMGVKKSVCPQRHKLTFFQPLLAVLYRDDFQSVDLWQKYAEMAAIRRQSSLDHPRGSSPVTCTPYLSLS